MHTQIWDILKLSSHICFVAKPLKYISIPADFDALHLHKANSMNNPGLDVNIYKKPAGLIRQVCKNTG
jgi:hypothetical protein